MRGLPWVATLLGVGGGILACGSGAAKSDVTAPASPAAVRLVPIVQSGRFDDRACWRWSKECMAGSQKVSCPDGAEQNHLDVTGVAEWSFVYVLDGEEHVVAWKLPLKGGCFAINPIEKSMAYLAAYCDITKVHVTVTATNGPSRDEDKIHWEPDLPKAAKNPEGNGESADVVAVAKECMPFAFGAPACRKCATLCMLERTECAQDCDASDAKYATCLAKCRVREKKCLLSKCDVPCEEKP